MVFTSNLPPLEFPYTDLFSFLLPAEPRYPRDKIVFQSVEDPDRSYTCNELEEHACRIAVVLARDFDVKPGSVIAFISPNDIDFAPLLLGIWLAGGAATALNPSYTIDEMLHQLRDSKASTIIAHPSILPTATRAAEELSLPPTSILLLGPISNPSPTIPHWTSLTATITSLSLLTYTPPPIHPLTTPAFLPYSSGTTGLPKGVLLTHHNLTTNLLQTAQPYSRYITWHGGPCLASSTLPDIPPAPSYIPASPTHPASGGDAFLSALPVFHVYGHMFELLLPLFTGATSHFVSSRFRTAGFARMVRDVRPTMLFVVPPMLLWLVRGAGALEEELGVGWAGSVRAVLCGAAPLAEGLREEVRERFGWRVVQGYGMSEVGPVLALEGWEEEERGGVGRVIQGMELKVVGVEDGKEKGEDDEGELVVKGGNVFAGYVGREKETRACLSREGWFRTGDVGYVEKGTGKLFVTDRIKDIIKYHGFQVAPAELEAVLLKCDIVADVGVVGVKCPAEETEVPRAYCVRKGGKEEATAKDGKEVEEWVQTRLAKHKWLKGGVVWVHAIPKSPTGKILRRMLKQPPEVMAVA